MLRFWHILALFLGCCPALFVNSGSGADGDKAGEEFFERRIRPLLAANCFSCHGTEKKGGLSLESRAGLLAGGDGGTVVALGKPNESRLLTAVKYADEELQMPPSAKLAEQDIALLKEWIERGLPWPEASGSSAGFIRTSGAITAEDRQFWSFQPVKPQTQPAVKDTSWRRLPLDSFVLAALEAEKLAPAKEADKRTLLRRASFDLTGLPPTLEEVSSFLADESPDAYERLIDKLLASPRHGERWGRHWLDVARYAEDQAHTFAARMYPGGYRYRDWVIGSLNADMPYQQFVTEQIAADLTEGENKTARMPALGFFALGPIYYADAGCAPKAQADEMDDRIDTLTRGFLGLTVSCARCHDHKFDPIPTKDYYALAGVFASTEYLEAPMAPPDVVAAYDKKVARVKEQEKSVEDARSETQREIRESLALQTGKYAVAAWKLQNKQKKKTSTDPISATLAVVNAKVAAVNIAKEADLKEFVIEAWARFLSGDNVQKKPYLIAWKDAVAAQDGGIDLSGDAAALAAVQAAADQIQKDIATALDMRRKKEPLDKTAEELLKDVVDDNKGPCGIQKDQFDKLVSEEQRKALGELRKELEDRKKQVGEKYPVAHCIKDGAAKNLHVYIRGNYKEQGDEVPRRFLEILTSGEAKPFSQGSGRLELAQAIASEQNPLTARVLVNRVWQQHFGRGLVGTPSNFGMLGERPTHPELLDDLAGRFMASGWSLKWLHRQIMLSSTYRLSAELNQTNYQRDPDNRLLWRMNRRRLDIEAWRDSFLSASGNLDLSLGGQSVDLAKDNNRRRTLYAAVSRHNLNSTLR
ncbi:MAG: PSD1 domain-containing protein, partial [Pirellulaceae bacterium]|nr:PSD1 domain-containing protein [Pirellulaceae bacterium]